jgi:Tfp pilus assembly major pilin PilA
MSHTPEACAPPESPCLLADRREIFALCRFRFDPHIPEADDPASMNSRTQAGITWVEVLVIIVIIFVLWSLSIPAVTSTLEPGQMTQALSNMKQLHIAAQHMALDGETTGNTNLGWPGDIGGSFKNWAAQIVKGGYLTTNDLCKLLSARGVIVPAGKIPPMNETAVRVYAVTKNSPYDAVFLTSANFTNTPTGGEALNPSAKPFGNKGFVVFKKGGDGAILQSKKVGQTNVIGSFVPMCR